MYVCVPEFCLGWGPTVRRLSPLVALYLWKFSGADFLDSYNQHAVLTFVLKLGIRERCPTGPVTVFRCYSSLCFSISIYRTENKTKNDAQQCAFVRNPNHPPTIRVLSQSDRRTNNLKDGKLPKT